MRWIAACLLVLPGCATLHHVQIGEIDNTGDRGLRPFEIIFDAVAIDHVDALEAVSERLATIASLATMGPRTGLPLLRDRLGHDMVERLYEACPSGEITGLMSRRESRRMPLGGVESVRIRGYCRVD